MTTTLNARKYKLVLIDHRVSDIDCLINSTNDDTYCLVFNYFHDTQDTILSKIRFLSGTNTYMSDNFYYEEPIPPTQMDASGNYCTPCEGGMGQQLSVTAPLDGFDMSSFQLLPSTLYSEHLEYIMNNPQQDISGNTDISGNVTTTSSCWPFYPESTHIRKSPVFFQRVKLQNIETAPESAAQETAAQETATPESAAQETATPESVDSSANDITANNTSTEDNQINIISF